MLTFAYACVCLFCGDHLALECVVHLVLLGYLVHLVVLGLQQWMTASTCVKNLMRVTQVPLALVANQFQLTLVMTASVQVEERLQLALVMTASVQVLQQN